MVVLEGALRLTLTPGQLYGTHHERPELHQWRNEVRFFETYGAKPETFQGHDPALGWDIETTGDRVRGNIDVSLESDRLRIVAIGDSFTYGLDVAEAENFVSLLGSRHPAVETLNLGVPGYGIDQAVLKFEIHGQRLNPDVVLFGVYVGDYERSSLGFTSFAKPRFVPASGGLVLTGRPVPSVEQELSRIGERLSGRSYLVELVRNAAYEVTTGAAERRVFFDQTDEIAHHVFSQLIATLGRDQTLVVIHIPRAEAFVERDPFRDEMSARLLAAYDRLDIPFIDLGTAFVTGVSSEDVYQRYYVHEADGSVGHLSPEGHARVADLVAPKLAALGQPLNP